MTRSSSLHKLLRVVVLLGLLLGPVQPLASGDWLAAVQAAAIGRVVNSSYEVPTSGLYRTRLAVRQPADWARLERLGVAVLEQGDDWALVLADED